MTDIPNQPIKNPSSAYVLLHPFPSFSSFLASIIHLPPENKAQFYKDIVCTNEDKAHVRELISAMGEKGYLSLLSDRTHLRLIGSQINHVHPLNFLSTVFLDPYLTKCMDIVMEDRLKRTGLLEGHSGSNGLGHSLTREAEKGKLNLYLADFAIEVGIPVEDLRPFVDKRDWEALVRFMIWHKLSLTNPGQQ
jgi:hypothetical protein